MSDFKTLEKYKTNPKGLKRTPLNNLPSVNTLTRIINYLTYVKEPLNKNKINLGTGIEFSKLKYALLWLENNKIIVSFKNNSIFLYKLNDSWLKLKNG
jgi:predicted transcriptional regulator